MENNKFTQLLVVLLLLILAGCAVNNSRPTSLRAKLSPEEGVIVFSTEEDGTTDEYGVDIARAGNALLSLGLSEINTRNFMFVFKRHPEEGPVSRVNLPYKPALTLGHSFKSRSSAAKKKWHVVPVKSGLYELTTFKYNYSDSLSRKNSIPSGLLRFEVKPGEAVYLGSMRVALRDMPVKKTTTISGGYSMPSSYSTQGTGLLPVLTSHKWEDDLAVAEIQRYPLLPPVLNRAEFDDKKLANYVYYLKALQNTDLTPEQLTNAIRRKSSTGKPTKVWPKPTDYVQFQNIVIADEFELHSLNEDSVGARVGECISHMNNDASFQKRRNQYLEKEQTVKLVTSLGHASSSKRYVYSAHKGVCMEFSESEYPIYPAEVFVKTLNPNGVSPDVTEKWYRELAMLIAKKGSAKVFYKHQNGNGNIANYWVTKESPFEINYSDEFKKAGEWENGNFDAIYELPSGATFSATSRNKQKRKHPPFLHRVNAI